MRKRVWYEDEQARSDEQEADLIAARKRVGLSKKGTIDLKDAQQGEEAIKHPQPIGPQPWIRAIPYTTGGQIIVPKKPYHQEVIMVGAGGVGFEISFNPNFPVGQTGALPGDRNHVMMVYAGQQLWMRSAIIIGSLTVLVAPKLDAVGNTILCTDGRSK